MSKNHCLCFYYAIGLHLIILSHPIAFFKIMFYGRIRSSGINFSGVSRMLQVIFAKFKEFYPNHLNQAFIIAFIQMKINYNKGLKHFYIYQVLTWTIGIIVLVKGFYNLLSNNAGIDLLFITLLLFVLACYVIYINFCLLFNLQNNKSKLYLTFNKWIIFLQIFQISLLGFSAYFLVGIQFGVVYSYREIQSLNFIFNFCKLDIALNYQNSNAILVGINFVPIIIFIWLDKILKDYR